jgi:hypothetical protein
MFHTARPFSSRKRRKMGQANWLAAETTRSPRSSNGISRRTNIALRWTRLKTLKIELPNLGIDARDNAELKELEADVKPKDVVATLESKMSDQKHSHDKSNAK